MRTEAESRPAAGRGIHLLGSLRAHLRLAVAIAGIVFLLGIPLAWVKGKAEWTASATLRVSPRFAKNLETDQELELQSNTQYRDFVQQQIRTVNRLDIVGAALKTAGKGAAHWKLPGESELRAAQRLQSALAIRPVPDTYMFVVALSGPKPDGLADLVNAVVEAYLGTVSEEELWGAKARIGELEKQREELVTGIRAKTQRRAALGRELGMTTFSTGADMNAWDKLLLEARAALDAAERKRIEAEARLVSVDGAATKANAPAGEDALAIAGEAPAGRGPPETDAALEALSWNMVSLDSGLSALASSLTKRRSELLTQISGLTPDHPGRAAAEQELREIDAALAKQTEEVRKRARQTILAQRRAEALEAGRTTRDLSTMVETRWNETVKVAGVYNEALSLTADLDRERKRLDAIDNRIDFLALESRAPGWVRVQTKAFPPEIPSKGGRKKLLLLALVAAAGAALVVPVAVDLLDPRIRSANDAERVLGFAPLGWVVERSGAESEAFASDQLRRIAQKLDFDARTNGTRVVVLTSSKPGEGTTTLAFDLARSFGRLGLRPVVVEANALRPSPRYGAPAPGGGFAQLLASGGDPRAAVLPATGELPDRIPVGATGRSLAPITRLDEVLSALASAWDTVLVDAPPILLSADTEALVRVRGSVLLVIEAEALPKAVVRRALETAREARSPARWAPSSTGCGRSPGAAITRRLSRSSAMREGPTARVALPVALEVTASMRPLLAYALHSGNLYGTERMALETASGLADEFDPVILAPEGPALAEARRRGFEAVAFAAPRDVARALWRLLGPRRDVAFFATGLVHSAAFLAVNCRPAAARGAPPRRPRRDGRTALLRKEEAPEPGARLPRGRLVVREGPAPRARCPSRQGEGRRELRAGRARRILPEAAEPERTSGVTRAIAVSRVDPIKRLDLLLDAVEGEPALADLSVRVLGTGWQLDELRARAAARCPNVRFEGFSAKVPEELAASDLLVHTCPEEPFGLAILEAFAAGVPVLVPDSGGAGSLVAEGIDGFRFRAGDAADLRRRLVEIRALPGEKRAAVVEGARRALAGRFSARRGIAEYRALVAEALG